MHPHLQKVIDSLAGEENPVTALEAVFNAGILFERERIKNEVEWAINHGSRHGALSGYANGKASRRKESGDLP